MFICYKETDNNGRRTQDSVLANDLYYQLKQEGFKVFFARITLEDKLGSAYEPYIFAALNSAKVMVVLGTRPEYFNAVWVKNEWSRYLSIVKASRGKKTLIPAYRDMDPYDLPEEFSHLQAQDMSKLGFMQDLIRGIKKITADYSPKASVNETVVINQNSAETAPLLKRAFMFLEDGDWNSADEYCERVLDMNPECAEAYLGKLMAELHCSRRTDLREQAKPFEHRNNYEKVIRFADEKLKTEMTNCIQYIYDRNEHNRLDGIYRQAKAVMESAKREADFKQAAKLFQSVAEYEDSATLAEKCLEQAETARKDDIYRRAKSVMGSAKREADFKQAAKLFQSIAEYKDSATLAEKCLEQAETSRKDDIYRRAKSVRGSAKRELDFKQAAELFQSIAEYKDSAAQAGKCLELAESVQKDAFYDYAKAEMSSEQISSYENAIRMLEYIPGWRDADEQIIVCQNKIKEIREKEEQQRLAQERQAELRRQEEEKHKKKKKKITIIVTSIVCVCIAFVIVLQTVIIPSQKLKEAHAFLESGDYNEAYALLEEIKRNDVIAESKYDRALVLLESSDYISSYELLSGLNYEDSKEKLQEIKPEYFNALLQNPQIGDKVFFGTYEQDNDSDNGEEDIEWQVLDRRDGKILVISKYALYFKPYNTEDEHIIWESCTLRKWLNDDFLNAAFTEEDQKMISAVSVSTDKNPQYDTNPGNATQDQIFLLSISEAEKYFSSNATRSCKSTAYAVASNAWKSTTSSCWWLRSPGSNQHSAAYVLDSGVVSADGDRVIIDHNAVRPAMWINLES